MTYDVCRHEPYNIFIISEVQTKWLQQPNYSEAFRTGPQRSTARGLCSPLEFQGGLWVTISFDLILFFSGSLRSSPRPRTKGCGHGCPGVVPDGNSALRDWPKVTIVRVNLYIQQIFRQFETIRRAYNGSRTSVRKFLGGQTLGPV